MPDCDSVGTRDITWMGSGRRGGTLSCPGCTHPTVPLGSIPTLKIVGAFKLPPTPIIPFLDVGHLGTPHHAFGISTPQADVGLQAHGVPRRSASLPSLWTLILFLGEPWTPTRLPLSAFSVFVEPIAWPHAKPSVGVACERGHAGSGNAFQMVP